MLRLRAPRGFLFALILVVAGFGCRNDPAETGLRFDISLNVTVDQLQFTVSNSGGVLVDHRLRPRMPDGALAAHQIVEIYLFGGLDRTNVTCDVVGLLGGKAQAAVSQNVMLMKDTLVLVTISLGTAAEDAGAGAEHPAASHDGALDVGAAGDAMDAAGDLGVGVAGDGAKVMDGP